MTTPLGPCPFPHEVKHGVFLETDTVDFGFVRGACADCGCAGPYVTPASLDKITPAEQAEAVRLWNDRTLESQVAALREALEKIADIPITDIYARPERPFEIARSALNRRTA